VEGLLVDGLVVGALPWKPSTTPAPPCPSRGKTWTHTQTPHHHRSTEIRTHSHRNRYVRVAALPGINSPADAPGVVRRTGDWRVTSQPPVNPIHNDHGAIRARPSYALPMLGQGRLLLGWRGMFSSACRSGIKCGHGFANSDACNRANATSASWKETSSNV
jgi:hypothetical protein